MKIGFKGGGKELGGTGRGEIVIRICSIKIFTLKGKISKMQSMRKNDFL